MAWLFSSLASLVLRAVCIFCLINSVCLRPKVSESRSTGGHSQLSRHPDVLRFEPENNLYSDRRIGDAVQQEPEPKNNVVVDKKQASVSRNLTTSVLEHEGAHVGPLKHEHDDSSKDQQEELVSTNERTNHILQKKSRNADRSESVHEVTGNEVDNHLSEEENEDEPVSTAEQKLVSANEHNHILHNNLSEEEHEDEPVSTAEQKLVSANEHKHILHNNLSEEEHEDEPVSTAERDDCDIHNEVCSPFFGSPCNKIIAPGEYHRGKCSMSEAEAEKRWKPCGDVTAMSGRSACYCYDDVASCCANLTSIPNFNKTIRYLNFTSNSLTRLDDVVLRNSTQLKVLILNRNNISVVTTDALREMESLEHFELAYNEAGQQLDPVNFTVAVNSVNGTLKVLAVNYTGFSRASGGEFGMAYVVRHLRLTNLTQLFVDGGPMRVFYLSDVHRLPRLCKLSLKSHMLKRVYCCSVRSFNDSFDDNDDCLKLDDDNTNGSAHTCVSPQSRNASVCQNFTLGNLQLLGLDNNSLVRVPRFCNSGELLVLPNLTHLSIATNAVINPQKRHFKCLQNVQSMALTGNPLKHIEARVFQELQNLHDVDLRFTNVMWIEASAFAHPTLRQLTIKSSNWFMNKDDISSHLFNGTNLTWVDLSYNVFTYADDDKIKNILTPLNTVSTLLMAEIGLKKIPDIVIEDFMNLEHLSFPSNLMSKIPHDAFKNMSHLRYLNIRHNDLASPDVDMLEALLERNVSINLESNPFSCTCGLLAFLNLYKARGSLVHHLSNSTEATRLTGRFVGSHYVCIAPEDKYNTPLEKVQMSVHACLMTIEQEILVYAVCLLFILYILVYTLLYKYRWQVRFWLYTMHMRLARRGANPQRRSRARFTAFVSYCKEDSNFVLTKVLPALESTRRLPLCIHERDFIPGRYISQNIVERMEESRHVLLILSNASLKNDWSRFELFVAHRYGVIHRQIPVTTLLLEPLSVSLMDAHVITLLQAMPWIEWPGCGCSPSDVERFWSRLGETLRSRAM